VLCKTPLSGHYACKASDRYCFFQFQQGFTFRVRHPVEGYGCKLPIPELPHLMVSGAHRLKPSTGSLSPIYKDLAALLV